MEGIEILFWGLSVLFCLVMAFAILVWCRGWRRQEREETERQIQALATEVARLASAIEALDHTAASLKTADEQLAGGIGELREAVSRVRALASASAAAETTPVVARTPSAPPRETVAAVPAGAASSSAEDRADREESAEQEPRAAGVTTTQLRGVWSGAFENVTLLGRSLSGDVDWQFDTKDFEVRFLDPPDGQAERVGGGWKFSDGKLVLTLRTSFPIGDDVGVTDTLFVSIFGNEISMRTSAGSSILLYRTQALLRPGSGPGANALYCRGRDALLYRRRVCTAYRVGVPFAG